MSIRPKILVTGSNGQLGKELKRLCSTYEQFEFIFLSREDLSIVQFELVRNFFQIYHPHYCINCAAYTAVDKAEAEKDLAFQINGEAVGVLAAICKEYNTQFVHVSTDYIFEGTGNIPYTEEFAPHPQSVYGASKLDGEQQALQFNPESIIIRTSWVYSEFGKNFVKTMMRLMNEKETIGVVNDQFGSPTYAADLASAIMQIICADNWWPGIYNYCNKGIISWFDFANAIKEIIGSPCKIYPITTQQYPTPAKRPGYSALDTAKIQKVFNIQIPGWKESLQKCIMQIRSAVNN
jgi:dTDP-4-dehydrorhamnose reductase